MTVVGAALPQRQVERLEHQLRAQMGLHRPAHDPAAENIKHHREVEKPGPGRDVGDIGDPQAIGLRRDEVALDQIGRRPRAAIAHRGVDPLAPADPDQTGLFQQPRHPLAPDLMPSAREFGVDPWRAIGRARALMNRAHAKAELRIGAAARRGRPLAPRIEAAGGDAQYPAHRRDPITGLIRTHELERRDGSEPVSVANQAAAFESISRSSRSTRFSRRKPVEFLALRGGQSIAAPTFIAVGLRHPVANRLRGGLELARQFLGVASRPHQLHHPLPILRRVPFVRVSHRGLSSTCPTPLLSTKPGQLQDFACEALCEALQGTARRYLAVALFRQFDPSTGGSRP